MSDTDSSKEFPRKFGKYHLLSHLAQGGMGALYLAVTGDRGFERLLCIKTVLPHLADEEYLARFSDEAKIVVQLSHGNLIPVFDAGKVDGELFLAMDFVKGKDLRAVWNRCAQKAVAFPIDVAVYITKELCRGLGYAHSFGDINLVHRDVSPPNVLVSYGGEVKLTDFGLASSTLKTEKTLPGIIYGKVAYMSPEQARGQELDGRSDIYACGIILWELLTGRQLFPPGEEQPQDLLARARNPDVGSASARAPRVPGELDAIVAKALCSDPKERYETAEEFRDALGAWLAVNHPATDVGRIESFIGQLFEEEVVSEEAERLALIRNTRDRMKTLPPTDELRQLLEKAKAGDPESLDKLTDRRQDSAVIDNPGRRAPDNGTDSVDRRGARGRRMADAIDGTMPGIADSSLGPAFDVGMGQAVEVLQAGPDGSTAVSRPAAAVATAEAIRSVDVSPSEILGKVLENRYRVEKLIGEGGMGRVYLAEHVDIGKKVAVKVLHPVYGGMPDLVERFRREARAASKIGHPNIVDVTDSGTTEDGSVYFVMEYLKGVELAGVIDGQGAIDIRRALDISTQVCRALSAAHAVGIIHRDLKPENIFLTSREGTSDFVKVLDFGIAKSTEAEEARTKKLTSPGMAMGTPEYMAPEQAAGKIADERCDVYALGAILYEMLTGSAPYEGSNFLEILTKKATTEPIPARELRSDIPVAVEELLVRAMARDPDGRPPSMEAMEYELTKCFAGRGAAVSKILGIAADEGFASNTRAITVDGEDGVFVTGGILPTEITGGVRIDDVSNANLLNGKVSNGDVSDLSLGKKRKFGWIVYPTLLLCAAGALALVVSGEDSDTASPEAVQDAESATKGVSKKVRPNGGKSGRDKSRRSKSDRNPKKSKSSTSATKKDPEKAHLPKPPPDRKNKASIKAGVRATTAPQNKREAKRLLAAANKDLSSQRLDSARQQFQRILKGKYLKSRANLGMAKVLFEGGEFEKSIPYAKLAGKSSDAQMVLADAYLKSRDYRRALKIYEAVLRKTPDKASAIRNREAARKKLGIK